MTEDAAPARGGSESRSIAPDARRRMLIVDLLSVGGGTLIAMALHRPLGIAPEVDGAALRASVTLFVIFDLVLLLRLALAGEYDVGRRFRRVEDVVVVARCAFIAACVAVTAAVATKGFFLEFEQYSRGLLALGFGVPTVLLLAHRVAGFHYQRQAFRAGRALERQLVIGDGVTASRYLDWVADHLDLGIAARASEAPLDLDIRTYMQQLSSELEEWDPDIVVLALEQARPDLRAAVAREASFTGRSVEVLPEVFENHFDLPFTRGGGVPVSHVLDSEGRRFAMQLKYAVDRVGAVLGLIVLLPLLALVALAIVLEDRGPVIFAQERVGERGRRFQVRKFRTMHVDAEARMADLRASNEADGPIFKMRDDPRITRVGRWLRRTSLDELPQLWNVAFGDMSLVGPRPPLPSEVDEYRLEHVRRLMARPGMTGLWQVSGRSETTFDEMVRLDLVYIEDWSFQLDAKILLRTVGVVLRRRGAY